MQVELMMMPSHCTPHNHTPKIHFIHLHVARILACLQARLHKHVSTQASHASIHDTAAPSLQATSALVPVFRPACIFGCPPLLVPLGCRPLPYRSCCPNVSARSSATGTVVRYPFVPCPVHKASSPQGCKRSNIERTWVGAGAGHLRPRVGVTRRLNVPSTLQHDV